MKILISGGSGFVGRHLSSRLMAAGHHVVATSRRARPARHRNLRHLVADTTQPGPWLAALQEVDAVINLTGRPVFNLWTQAYKQSIYDSRILTTRHLVNGLPTNRRLTLLNASAAGFYGDRGDELLGEETEGGHDFLAFVCRDWEQEANRATAAGHRVVAMRFGVVLGKNGGALKTMLPPFLFGLGGPLGNGQQWFPWITLDDLVEAVLFLLDHPDLAGPVNFCAPGAVRNRDFAATLARALHRPALLPAPAFAIRLLLGEFGRSLLSSQRVVPQKLLRHGFTFKYPALPEAMASLIQ